MYICIYKYTCIYIYACIYVYYIYYTMCVDVVVMIFISLCECYFN